MSRTRKRPYRHRVVTHIRDGITVETYKRGQGDKPHEPTKPRKGVRGQTGYTVSILFSEGKENYNVAGGTYTGALKDGLTRIQRPEIPQRVQIRRHSR